MFPFHLYLIYLIFVEALPGRNIIQVVPSNSLSLFISNGAQLHLVEHAACPLADGVQPSRQDRDKRRKEQRAQEQQAREAKGDFSGDAGAKPKATPQAAPKAAEEKERSHNFLKSMNRITLLHFQVTGGGFKRKKQSTHNLANDVFSLLKHFETTTPSFSFNSPSLPGEHQGYTICDGWISSEE